jgi:hypothetical protein
LFLLDLQLQISGGCDQQQRLAQRSQRSLDMIIVALSHDESSIILPPTIDAHKEQVSSCVPLFPT